MNPTEAITLVDYNAWATGHILDAAARLEPEQFTAILGSNTSSLQSILVHALSAERLWRVRLQSGISPSMPNTGDIPDVDSLRQLWHEEAAAFREYLMTLDDGALEETVQFRRLSGELSDPIARWVVVTQLVTHGTQHRSEAATLLTSYGQSPGDLDFLFFILRLR
ncbi:MAG: DinB family protein [Dehalococcoidia bacterium]